jgi:tetratricopeptide (TPR) repeat protein
LKVLRDLGLAEQTRFEAAALEQIAKRLGVEMVLYGDLTQDGQQVGAQLVLSRIGSGVTIPVTGNASQGDVFALVDELTQQVKGHLDLTPEQKRAEVDRPVVDVSTDSLEAQRAYLEGLDALRHGSYQGAVSRFTEAARLDPGFVMAHARLAESQYHSGHVHEAGAASDRALRLAEDPALPRAERYLVRAIAGLVGSNYEATAHAYHDLVELYPDDPDLNLGLADAYESLGHLKEAAESYQRALALAPEYDQAVLGLGRVLVTAGDYDEAVSLVQQGLDEGRFAPDLEALAMAHAILGLAFLNGGAAHEAEQHLKQALAYREENGDLRGQATTLFNLANLYRHSESPRQAMEMASRSLAISRQLGDRRLESQALKNIGILHREAGNLDAALQPFRESVQIEMELDNVTELAVRLQQVSELYSLKGLFGEATIYLEQARDHLERSGSPVARAHNLVLLGRLKQSQGRFQETIDAMLEAAPLLEEAHEAGELAAVYWVLGQTYTHLGSFGDAYNTFKKSEEVNATREDSGHDLPDLKAAQGTLLIALGRFEDATKELTEAQELAHGHVAHGTSMPPEVLLAKADLALLRGDLEEAAASFREANYQSNLSRQLEKSVRSRVALGRLFREQRRFDDARAMLERSREEARTAQLRPLEAAASVELAALYAARGSQQEARLAAQEAVTIARPLSARPLLFQAHNQIGGAALALGDREQAVDAYAEAAAQLESMRKGVLAEHVGTFMAQPDVQNFLRTAAPLLEDAGRPELAPLQPWVGSKEQRQPTS